MKLAYLLLAWFSLGLAGLGILLPGLPATEFVLVAVWMLKQPTIHRLYYDWQEHRGIALRYKIVSSVSMLLCLVILICTVKHTPSVIFAACGMGIGALYIWTRATPN